MKLNINKYSKWKWKENKLDEREGEKVKSEKWNEKANLQFITCNQFSLFFLLIFSNNLKHFNANACLYCSLFVWARYIHFPSFTFHLKLLLFAIFSLLHYVLFTWVKWKILKGRGVVGIDVFIIEFFVYIDWSFSDEFFQIKFPSQKYFLLRK